MATRADADLFLHLGDQSYNDGNTSLSGFRDAWRSTLVEPGYLALHESMGFYQTWDDHEVDNDYDPTSVPSSVLNAAFQSFYETYAIETGPGGGLWNSYAWGDTAEFIILDSRSERYVPDDSYYISQAQMDFVKQRLSESTAHFKVLLNSVPITDMPTGYFGEGDRWEGYDRQRDELLNHITSNDIRNVWFLSGDFHIGMVTRVNNSGPARRIHEIAVGPGDNSNPAASLLDTLERFSGTDQLIWNTTSFQSSVQTILTFDPGRNQVRIEFREPDGDPIYDVWLSEGS
jgi:alkaline phosphatase D